MAFAIGHISGCHLNPAVSVGLWAGGRVPAKQLLPYIVAQVLGAVAGLFHSCGSSGWRLLSEGCSVRPFIDLSAAKKVNIYILVE